MKLGDQITVTHRDGTMRQGVIFEMLPERPRGPAAISYQAEHGNFVAHPGYGDKIVVGVPTPIETSSVKCLDPDRGLKPEPYEPLYNEDEKWYISPQSMDLIGKMPRRLGLEGAEETRKSIAARDARNKRLEDARAVTQKFKEDQLLAEKQLEANLANPVVFTTKTEWLEKIKHCQCSICRKLS